MPSDRQRQEWLVGLFAAFCAAMALVVCACAIWLVWILPAYEMPVRTAATAAILGFVSYCFMESFDD
jgi:hypothetical protein